LKIDSKHSDLQNSVYPREGYVLGSSDCLLIF